MTLENIASLATVVGVVIVILGIVFIAGWWTRGVTMNTSILDKALNELRGMFREILSLLSPRVSKSESPEVLTELGSNIAAELSVHGWAKSTGQDIFPSVKDMSRYEIQEYCKEFVYYPNVALASIRIRPRR